MPTLAPVERAGLLGGRAVGVEVGVVVGMERVAVRAAMVASRVKYTGRSRLDQPEAGAVTVAPPREEPPIVEKISGGTI